MWVHTCIQVTCMSTCMWWCWHIYMRTLDHWEGRRGSWYAAQTQRLHLSSSGCPCCMCMDAHTRESWNCASWTLYEMSVAFCTHTHTHTKTHVYTYTCTHTCRRACICKGAARGHQRACQRCLVLHVYACTCADRKTYVHACIHTWVGIEYMQNMCQILCVHACRHVNIHAWNTRMHSYIHEHSKTRLESTCNMFLGRMRVHAHVHAHICARTHQHTQVLLKFISSICIGSWSRALHVRNVYAYSYIHISTCTHTHVWKA